jgi:hypothetical protein
MKLSTILLMAVEAIAVMALIVAALQGDTTVVGLHVRKLAYDEIAFTFLAVCVVSCIVATLLLFRLAKAWRRGEVVVFVCASAAAWLCVSAFENARGLTFNGASRHWFSWPACLWLLALLFGFVILACRSHRGTA